MSYDAFVLVSFGGPERPEDVIPFLENVTRGRDVPPERLAEVAEHYQHFGGVSPINQQSRDLLAALAPTSPRTGRPAGLLGQPQLAPDARRHRAPDARRRRTPRARVRDQRVRRLLVVPAVPGGHRRGPGRRRRGRPGDRQAAAVLGPPGLRRAARRRGARRAGHARPGPAGHHPAGLHRPLHPGLDGRAPPAPTAGGTRPSSPRPPGSSRRRRPPTCAYDLVWQSRSGPPQVPWLEPDVNDHLAALAARRHDQRRGEPDRVRLRPPGGGLGPGHRGGGHREAARARLRPGRHAGHRSPFVAMVR